MSGDAADTNGLPGGAWSRLFRWGSRMAGMEFFRFCMVGTVGFIVDAGTLALLVASLVPNPYWARLISYLLAATTTWILNRSFTFRVTGGGGKHWEWVRYVVLNAVGGGLNYGTYALLVYRFPLVYAYPVLGVVAGSAVGLVVNYSANKFLVFGRRRCEPASYTRRT